jgi:ATP-dependent Clp protease adapter protein ClpS
MFFLHSTEQTPDILEIYELETVDSHNANGNGHVILFNDDYHTFDEVIVQILKATHCSIQKAEQYTWEVHHNGKSNVYQGLLTDCLFVSAVLEEIDLKTHIEY